MWPYQRSIYAASSSERSGSSGAEGVLPTPKRPTFRKSLMVLSPVLVAVPAVSPKLQITTKIAPKAPSGMLRLQGRVASIHRAAEKGGVLGNCPEWAVEVPL